MNGVLRIKEADLMAYSNSWGWFFTFGIALIVLGILAIGATTLTTMVSVIFLGILILISSVVVIFDTFAFWWGKWSGFLLHLIMGLIYFAIGMYLIRNPIMMSLSLTFVLGVFYVMLGGFKLFTSTSLRVPNWGWNLFNGFITLLLGMLIIIDWPASGLFVIGLFVGIDLLLCGIAYTMTALAAHSLTTTK